VVGYVTNKPTTTTAEILFQGTISGTFGLTKAGKVYLSASGGFDNAIPTGGYIQILGHAIDSDTVDFDPSNTKIKRYHKPLTPPLTEEALVYTTSVNVDAFSNHFDVVDDVMVVGALSADEYGSDRGIAVVFRKNASGIWMEDQVIPPGDSQDQMNFGSSIRLSADKNLLLISASNYENTSGDRIGSMYVYRFNGTSYVKEKSFYGTTSSQVNEGGGIDGNTLAFYQGNTPVVYVYDGSDWVHQQHLTASYSPSYGNIYISGDRILTGQQIVTIWDRSGTTWSQTAHSGSGQYVYFYSDGTNVLVCPTSGSQCSVITIDGNTLSPVYSLPIPSGATNYVQRGDINTDTVVLGDSSRANDQGTANYGAYYVFKFDGTDWVLKETYVHDAQDAFGYWVILDGDYAYISASGYYAPHDGEIHVYR
jgi:hypothetical protein